VFFREQTVAAVVDAMATLEAVAGRFEPGLLRARAAHFDRPIFARRVRDYVKGRLRELQARRQC
jgi:hypothetical protein